ncbi:hydrophobin [Fusarium albosuccineum]|uniref:Hydrophobin n=1 Tax=Fusarium albosuccineum TaxID=1237068 RepID=A0A8H4PJK4_9HYPO|nr:hydrophobin [Fusarium albosuccineum]
MARFTSIVLFIASAAALVPLPRNDIGNTDILTAQKICGSDLEVNCCNKEKTEVTGQEFNQGGILSGILGEEGLGLFGQCSPLSVSNLIGAGDLLNSHCKQKVACCENNQAVTGGLVNVGLPCIALTSLLG